MSNLHAENMRRREESIQLLNWIKTSVLLQNMDKVVRFANMSSKRLLKKFHQREEDLTLEDTEQRIFSKV